MIMSVDWVRGAPQSLDLLCDSLCVGRSENTELGGGAESGWEVVEQVGDGVRQAGGCEEAGAEERVAREGVK